MLGQAKKLNEGVTITLNITQSLDCWGDAQQIKQVLINLISNALNDMKDGKGDAVEIVGAEESGENSSDQVVLSIIDNGPGVGPDIVENIFEPFFTTREHGTGLGLAIVKQIIESHGGTIQVANNGKKGSTFTVHLPLPDDHWQHPESVTG